MSPSHAGHAPEPPHFAPSSTYSDTLASYVTDYKVENNRRYHAYKAGSYWGPNDESACEGQDLAHEMYNLTLGALHLAPISESSQILDIGTGTGIWAIEMADRYPEAVITGIDLSPIQPELVPVNCSFEIDDATLKWAWPDNDIDFVHVREMFGCIPDWDAFSQEALRCIRPGGFIEIVEHSTWPACLSPSSINLVRREANGENRSATTILLARTTFCALGERRLRRSVKIGGSHLMFGTRADRPCKELDLWILLKGDSSGLSMVGLLIPSSSALASSI